MSLSFIPTLAKATEEQCGSLSFVPGQTSSLNEMCFFERWCLTPCVQLLTNIGPRKRGGKDLLKQLVAAIIAVPCSMQSVDIVTSWFSPAGSPDHFLSVSWFLCMCSASKKQLGFTVCLWPFSPIQSIEPYNHLGWKGP